MAFTNRRVWTAAGAGLVIAFAAMQAVPYGRAHVNPPVMAEPLWDSAGTRALAQRACFDCHSNQTEWPSYAHVAPVSWLVQHDVDEGRAALNFSEWHRPQKEAGKAAAEIVEGEMPPVAFRLLHESARLTAAEREALARGLTRTLGLPAGRSN